MRRSSPLPCARGATVAQLALTQFEDHCRMARKSCSGYFEEQRKVEMVFGQLLVRGKLQDRMTKIPKARARARATSRRSYFLTASAYARESRMLKLRSKCRNIHSSFNLFCNGRCGGKSLIMRTAASPTQAGRVNASHVGREGPASAEGCSLCYLLSNVTRGLHSLACSQPCATGAGGAASVS